MNHIITETLVIVSVLLTIFSSTIRFSRFSEVERKERKKEMKIIYSISIAALLINIVGLIISINSYISQ